MINSDGSRSIIDTKYHRGEVSIWNSRTRKESWPVDGHAKTDHGTKVYEFQGKRWHAGCHENCTKCEPNVQNSQWIAKKEDILRQGYKLEVIWECQFDELLPTIQAVSTPTIPDILQKTQSEESLLDGIKNGKYYGFIVCTVSSPPDVINKMSDFPPVIKRLNVEDKHLTDTTRQQIKLEKPNLKKFERETLVQCFNAKDHLLMTNLARYYMESGLIISNIETFIQYIPKKSLAPFVNLVTTMRIDAEKNNLPTKGNTAKMFGNGAYGKVCS